jgi:hypothetical protein
MKMENQTELKWYQKPNGVIILLIIFFPVGLYLMWKNELWTKKSRLIVTSVFAVMIIANTGNNNSMEDACECADVLNVPTQKVGIGMPLPIEHLSNEDFRKYEKCYDAYAGPATATLKCAGR